MANRHAMAARTRLIALALGSALFGTFLGGAALGKMEAQPNMVAARQSLTEAINQLNQAPKDKGGHRFNAIKLAQRAIVEINLGISYADQH